MKKVIAILMGLTLWSVCSASRYIAPFLAFKNIEIGLGVSPTGNVSSAVILAQLNISIGTRRYIDATPEIGRVSDLLQSMKYLIIIDIPDMLLHASNKSQTMRQFNVKARTALDQAAQAQDYLRDRLARDHSMEYDCAHGQENTDARIARGQAHDESGRLTELPAQSLSYGSCASAATSAAQNTQILSDQLSYYTQTLQAKYDLVVSNTESMVMDYSLVEADQITALATIKSSFLDSSYLQDEDVSLHSIDDITVPVFFS